MDLPHYHRCHRQIDPQLSYELAINENPRNATASTGGHGKRGVAGSRCLWQPGRTLWISFVGAPDRNLKMAIFELASQWTDLSEANIEFDLAENNDLRAQIRILTETQSLYSESAIGTDSLAPTEASMVLNVKPDHKDFQAIVLHEFGHALGMDHEHQHPEANIPWNEPALRLYHEMLGWSDHEIDHNFFNKRTEDMIKTAYDPTSIMHYSVPKAWTWGEEIGINHELSEKDLEFMRLAYPHG
ncbi:M12 family metallopeptidase [Pseudomonas sp. KU43P]|uniref:M12 family metallopeptidase n=1 Tax=Pseudomonas sp. KU43P TaxID=2487887 RepID=UPI0012A7AC4D|nr:M12 family metallopeptidase [Pseudomonas sp. KU43P]BBH44674.1 hypothetical protein KU43P_11510 [Pseudomonas sp. KU43P]